VRVPLDRLLLKPNVSAGASILVICSLVLLYRNTTEDADAPVLIREAGDGLYRILDGRHRFMASVIAGRVDLWCALEVLD
jgi:hypothetical protein